MTHARLTPAINVRHKIDENRGADFRTESAALFRQASTQAECRMNTRLSIDASSVLDSTLHCQEQEFSAVYFLQPRRYAE